MDATGYRRDHLRTHRARYQAMVGHMVTVPGHFWGTRGSVLCLTEAGVAAWMARAARGRDPRVDDVLAAWREHRILNADRRTAEKLVHALGDEAGEYVRWYLSRPEADQATQLGYLHHDKPIMEWRRHNGEGNRRRCDPLPPKFLQWCRENAPLVFDRHELDDFNDLNGLVTHVSHYRDTDGPEARMVAEARRRGLLPETGYRHLVG